MEFNYCEATVLTKTIDIPNITDCVIKVYNSTKLYSAYLLIKCNMGIAKVLKMGSFIEGVGINDRFKLECYNIKPDYCSKEIAKFIDIVYNTKNLAVEEVELLSWESLREELPTYLDVEQLLKDNLK